MPNINLFLPWIVAQYRIVCGAGVVHDLLYKDGEFCEQPGQAEQLCIESEWQYTDQYSATQELTVQLKHPELITEDSSIITYVAVETLVLFPGKGPMPIRVGSAKILEVA